MVYYMFELRTLVTGQRCFTKKQFLKGLRNYTEEDLEFANSTEGNQDDIVIWEQILRTIYARLENI
jgi:hypothetical protein